MISWHVGSELPWNFFDPERSDPRYEGARQIVKRAPAMSATWGNSEKIYSLGVLPPVTKTDLQRTRRHRSRQPRKRAESRRRSSSGEQNLKLKADRTVWDEVRVVDIVDFLQRGVHRVTVILKILPTPPSIGTLHRPERWALQLAVTIGELTAPSHRLL